MKNLTKPIFELQLMRHNSVVIDTTRDIILLPQLTRQVKSANGEKLKRPNFSSAVRI